MTSLPLKVDLKNPVIAGLLAFLCPGAGHFYQKRFFKAFVFAIGIWGSWWTGMAMSDWKALQAPAMGDHRAAVVLKFGGQAGVGTPGLWALYQAERYYDKSNAPSSTIPHPQEYPLTGQVEFRDGDLARSGAITGTLSLAPTQGDFGPAITGQFVGTLEGEAITVELGKNISLDKPVCSDRQAPVSATVINDKGEHIGSLQGTIPRPFFNWFACPLDQDEEAEWHRDRGKYQELAMVFVWVAGLMNLLAIWDAVEGPAYGYNDEEPVPVPAP